MKNHLFSNKSIQASCLRVFDFDGTITIKPSYLVDKDEGSIKGNIKRNIKSKLTQDNCVFGICSFLDSIETIVQYLTVIFGRQPQVLSTENIELFNKKIDQPIHAFTLTVVSIPDLSYPICITTLPKRTNTIDEKTGERNWAYHRAREALADNGQKNCPITRIFQYYSKQRILQPGQLTVTLYEDDIKNLEEASQLSIPGMTTIECIQVIPDLADFVESPLNQVLECH